MAVSELTQISGCERPGPAQADLDKCVHCGLCLNACPTYLELGVEMDSPRGRIYQMNQVANGAPVTDSYRQHIDLCLACRGCETACPSGVPYGRMIEAARAGIKQSQHQSIFNRIATNILFDRLLDSRIGLQIAGAGLYAYQVTGMQRLVRTLGLLKIVPELARLDALSPTAEAPFFFSKIGKTSPALGKQRYRVAFLSGCIANVAFARLNEATVRVLQANGCEVVIPEEQGCCGALHLHSGFEERAKSMARRNIDALKQGNYDAIITNAAGCGSTLKEYDHLLRNDASYRPLAVDFKSRMKDITEFLASIELNPNMETIDQVVTYQDSCHLSHGQKIKSAPRKLLASIPGLTLREMQSADVCCGSAGVYNVVQTSMAMQILKRKMEFVSQCGASTIATANPGCMLQLAAGVRLFGEHQRVVHVVELLDEAYSLAKR